MPPLAGLVPATTSEQSLGVAKIKNFRGPSRQDKPGVQLLNDVFTNEAHKLLGRRLRHDV